MRLPRFRIRMMMVMVAVIALILFVGATMWRTFDNLSLNPPQDREVRALFAANRADFEAVRDMILANPTYDVYLSPHGQRDLQASPTQLKECHRFMRRLGVHRVERSRQRGENAGIAFDIYTFGNVADSYTKRIVYSRTPLEPLRPDTDTPEFQRDNSIVYSEIGDGWYIEKERD